MKTICLCVATVLLSIECVAQQPQLTVFKHELRWADETRFPNFFLVPEVREAIFDSTKLELMHYLKVPEITFPTEVEYKIINGFGKQKIELPKPVQGINTEIGIFSFITRATAGNAIFWQFNIIIKQNNRTILKKEVIHELEYFNSSGYLTGQQWMSAAEFQEIFIRLLKESLGSLPASDEKITVGSMKSIEEEVLTFFTHPQRRLLKMNGAWNSSGNFTGLLESVNDTTCDFYFKEGWTMEYAKPTMGSALSNLFSIVTGVNLQYNQEVKHKVKGSLLYADGHTYGISLKWIEMENRTTLDNDVTTQISDPLTAEFYDQKGQAGYFLYTRKAIVHTTNKTKEKFDIWVGYQNQNTLGTERIHQIEGSLYNTPVSAEYNENKGIIKVIAGGDLLGVMIVQNCNPESSSIGGTQLSENKKFIITSSQNFKKPAGPDNKSAEWYPFYSSSDASDDSLKVCLDTLICLFFGLGKMQ
jgi:hypothetical protein